MDATIEEFGKLYPAYATLYFKDECEIVETAPKSDLDFRRLVVSGGEGYAFPRELAGDSVSFYSKAGCQEPMLLNSDGIFFAEVDGRVSYEPTGSQLVVASKLTSRDASFSRYLCAKKHKLISSSIANKYYAPLALPDVNIHYVAVPDRQNEYQVDLRELLRL